MQLYAHISVQIIHLQSYPGDKVTQEFISSFK